MSTQLPRSIQDYARLSFVHGMVKAFHSLGLNPSAHDELERIWNERNPTFSRLAVLEIRDSAEMLRATERMEHELVTCFRELLRRHAPDLLEEAP